MSAAPRRDGAASTLAEWTARGERVKAHVRLSDVIGRAVKLTRAGAEYDGLCPFHADRRIGSFKVNDAKGLYHCFSCGADGDHFRFLEKMNGTKFSDAVVMLESEAGLAQLAFGDPKVRADIEAARAAREAADAEDAAARRSRAAAMWHGSEPIGGRDRPGTPALAYLEGRGIDFAALGKVPGALRWRPDFGHRELKGKGANRHAAMIACIVALDGATVGVHRTYLDLSEWDFAARRGRVGKMRGVTDAKLSFGPSLGGHIPLWKGAAGKPLKDIPAGTRVYMSEGIEDGLSVACSAPDKFVIAGVSGSKLYAVDLPPQMGELVLIGQRHHAGKVDRHGRDISGEADAAFEEVLAAHQARGRTVSIMWPPEGFKDFNDVLTGKRMADVGDAGCGRYAR